MGQDRLPTIYAVLEDIAKTKSVNDKLTKLQRNQKINAVPAILRMVFDPKIKFSLPEGTPPYTPQEDMLDNTGGLYRDYAKIKYFMDHPQNTIHQIKRETLFIEMLESLHPKDAELLIAVKDKKLPFKGITEKLVKDAFPGLIK
jgi:hypothetical protein